MPCLPNVAGELPTLEELMGLATAVHTQRAAGVPGQEVLWGQGSSREGTVPEDTWKYMLRIHPGICIHMFTAVSKCVTCARTTGGPLASETKRALERASSGPEALRLAMLLSSGRSWVTGLCDKGACR